MVMRRQWLSEVSDRVEGGEKVAVEGFLTSTRRLLASSLSCRMTTFLLLVLVRVLLVFSFASATGIRVAQNWLRRRE